MLEASTEKHIQEKLNGKLTTSFWLIFPKIKAIIEMTKFIILLYVHRAANSKFDIQ